MSSCAGSLKESNSLYPYGRLDQDRKAIWEKKLYLRNPFAVDYCQAEYPEPEFNEEFHHCAFLYDVGMRLDYAVDLIKKQ